MSHHEHKHQQGGSSAGKSFEIHSGENHVEVGKDRVKIRSGTDEVEIRTNGAEAASCQEQPDLTPNDDADQNPENLENPVSETQAEETETGPEAESRLEELTRQLDEEIAKVRDLEDRQLRLTAEFDNFRKRSRKERDQAYQEAKMDAVKALLPVIDSLDRALEFSQTGQENESTSQWEGLELIRKQTMDCLEKMGVDEIEAEGVPFNPEFHDAIQHIEDETLDEGQVAKVVLRGFRVGQTVIRHSAVIVAN